MGNFVAGKFRTREGYKSFSPSLINAPILINEQQINYLNGEASRLIGELNAYSKLIPDVDFFIHMHITKEAQTSSRIEGTQTNFDEALMEEEEISPERRDDWHEVQNYTKAMNYAISQLETLPLSTRLLCETHSVLLSGARGKDKNPGEIRRSQNWIGGSNPSNAFFVPPHHEEISALLGDLDNFWHNEELYIPPLIKAAIGHYQFETIHPFCDGNGRIGRLLITLFLVQAKILHKPTLYLSDFFARNKGSYYDSLTVVRNSNDLSQWLKFFLSGVIETAQSSKLTFERIISLRQASEGKILTMGKRIKHANTLLKVLYSRPVIEAKTIGKMLNLTHPTVNSLIKEFQQRGLLKEITGFKRNRLYVFEQYLRIFMS